jgi:hypothetical protein
MVVYNYNPRYRGGRGRRISVQASPVKKSENLSEK